MSRWIRVALLYVEGLSTLAVGSIAVFAPDRALALITKLPADPAALAVTRQLGTAWIVAGLLACLATQLRDARSLRLVLLPLLVGDVLHVISVWPWDAAALTHLIPTTIYFANRGSIAMRPESFLRARA